MRRIPADFNTLTSAPVDLFKWLVVEPDGTSYEDLKVGEHVEMFEDEGQTGMRVEAVITERWHSPAGPRGDQWLAKPVEGTFRYVDLSPGAPS
jgi:hypothetical protein